MNLETKDNVEEEQKPGPWGFWPTVGFSAIIGIVFFLIQVVIIMAVVVVAMLRNPKLEIKQFSETLSTHGLLQIIVICAVAPFTIGLAILFAKIRKRITIKPNSVGANFLIIFSSTFDRKQLLLTIE